VNFLILKPSGSNTGHIFCDTCVVEYNLDDISIKNYIAIQMLTGLNTMVSGRVIGINFLICEILDYNFRYSAYKIYLNFQYLQYYNKLLYILFKINATNNIMKKIEPKDYHTGNIRVKCNGSFNVEPCKKPTMANWLNFIPKILIKLYNDLKHLYLLSKKIEKIDILCPHHTSEFFVKDNRLFTYTASRHEMYNAKKNPFVVDDLILVIPYKILKNCGNAVTETKHFKIKRDSSGITGEVTSTSWLIYDLLGNNFKHLEYNIFINLIYSGKLINTHIIGSGITNIFKKKLKLKFIIAKIYCRT
jgi:hypothetical protein